MNFTDDERMKRAYVQTLATYHIYIYSPHTAPHANVNVVSKVKK